MDNKSKFIIHPDLFLILWITCFSKIAGQQKITSEYSTENSSEDLSIGSKEVNRYSSYTLQRQERIRRDPYSRFSPAHQKLDVTQGNNDEETADNRLKHMIKLILPNGDVEISIKSLGNETKEPIELLVESLKEAITRLGYSLQLTTPDVKPNARTDDKIDRGTGRTYLITGRTHADLDKHTPVLQGARDLILDDSDEMNVDSQTSYYTWATVGGLAYTEYDEVYGYNQNQTWNDGLKSDEYAYLTDQDTGNDVVPDYSDSLEEVQRSRLDKNETQINKNTGNNDRIYFDNQMSPAEDEYENFGRAPIASRSPHNSFSVCSTASFGICVITVVLILPLSD